MDKQLSEKEKQLERAHLDREIASEKAEIASKRAAEAEFKKKYGTNWRKVLGLLGKSSLSDYYAVDPGLRDLAVPRRPRSSNGFS